MGSRVEDIVEKMHSAPNNVRYVELHKVCIHYFGEPRQEGTSHAVFRMKWQGDPRVNIQNDKGMAKRYQVGQVLKAIQRLESEEEVGK